MNIFANTSNQGQSSLFSKPQGQTGGLFSQGQNNTNTGLFGQNTQPNNSMGNNQSGGSNNIFGNNQNNQSGGSNSLFGNNQSGGSNNLFGNTQGVSNNLFGNTQGVSNNLFGNTQSGATNNLFGNNQSGNLFFDQGNYNQSGSLTGASAPNQFSQVNEAQLYHLLNAPEDQQRKLFEAFVPDYIKQLVALYRKNLDPSKVERLMLGNDNALRNEKVTKVATTLNIKPQLVQLKRLIRDNVTIKVKKLKENKEKMQNLSLDFSAKVYEKLQKYKEKLVLSVTQSKMLEEIKKEVDDLDQQIKEFFKPLFNAHQNRTNYSFVDPDPFCLGIAERLLKNMTILDNKMDQFLACESEQSEESLETGDVIVQLVEYYQNVAITLKEFSEKYNRLKHRMVQRSNQVNPGEVLRKITEKASSSVTKDMETYDLVKDIQSLLKKREGKSLLKIDSF